MSSRHAAAAWWIGLAVVLSIAAAPRLLELDSDPPRDVSRDLSLTTDASWYTAAAIDQATGRESGIGAAYDPPLYGWANRLAFSILGPSRRSAALVNVLFSLICILVTALAARRAYGDGAGLAAAVLLGLNYVFFVFSRAPGIYVALAALASGVLLLEACAGDGVSSRRVRCLRAAQWLLVALGVIGLKPIFLVVGAALVVSRLLPAQRGTHWLAMIRRRPVLAAALVVVGLALTALLLTSEWGRAQQHKIGEYLVAGGGLSQLPLRVLTLEARLGLVAGCPALVGLAALGCGRAHGVTRLALLTCSIFVALLAVLGYSPLRYFLPALPALTMLGARGLALLIAASGAEAEEKARDNEASARLRSPLLRVVTVLALGYAIAQASVALAEPLDLPPAVAALVGLVVGLVGAALWLGPRPVRLARPGRAVCARAAIMVAVTGLALVEIGRGGTALARAESSLSIAGRELQAVVPESAHLTGPFAHALTFETPQRRSYMPDLEFGGGRLAGLRELGVTHFTVEAGDALPAVLAAFRNDGVELAPVHEFVLRGELVLLFRFPWAAELVSLSDFELGLDALEHGRLDEARARLGAAARRYPRSAAVRAALGAVEMASGDRGAARELFRDALGRNPTELRALRAMLRLALERQDLAGALGFARRLARLDRRDTEARELAGKLEAAVPNDRHAR